MKNSKTPLVDSILRQLREHRPKGETLLPEQAFCRRDLNITDATKGGHTVDDRVIGIYESLLPHTTLLDLGATVVPMSGGAHTATVDTTATGSWVSETGSISDSTLTIGSAKPSPRRVGASIPVTAQTLSQSRAFQRIIEQELHRCIGNQIDIGGFSGAGGAEPIGLVFNENVGADTTCGGAVTKEDIFNAEEYLCRANGEQGRLGWATTPQARTKLRAIDAGGKPLWDGNTMLGHPAKATPNIAGDILLFGNWADLGIFIWSIELIVDPFTLKKSGKVEIFISALCDIAPFRPASFQKTTDSAAQ